MKWSFLFFLAILARVVGVVAVESSIPGGWSLEVGGGYSWVSFTVPSTESGSTGGVQGKITYQRANAFFGQIRSTYNLGPLSSSLNEVDFYEWYSEFVAGYCLGWKDWTGTLYAGLGLDFLDDDHAEIPLLPPASLHYRVYYALVGIECRYAWKNGRVALQVDALPTFNQYLHVEGVTAWVLHNRLGAAVRLPIAFQYVKNFWLELAPYYRFFPLGHANHLSERNLNEWGAFLSFRFFL